VSSRNRNIRPRSITNLMTEILSALLVFASCGLCAGNFWYTEGGVQKKIKAEYSEDFWIVGFERRIMSYTKILVVDGETQTVRTMCLDTNALFYYEFRPCS